MCVHACEGSLGAAEQGAELRAMSPPRQSIIVTFVATTMDPDATDLGAETCYLGAVAPSLGSILRNLSKMDIFVKFFPQKGQK
jgi:hypothetical protein